ncbi:MAG: flagellin A [Helicobacter sp.]|uniref:Flagellin n=3 Tax=Helicobacter bilis TaxID=37372 RepID=C3XDN1_9HELI|nr:MULTISPECIES: flagellin A [Helicobacter]AQQ59618.1 flagellin B [Helicobacter bilis]EEO23120.1 flagellin B [Helicobacter bilis ATCC 43879]EMZ39919.1 flagellin B [Helicobacter bilis WiWa]MCI7410870.1 flagellin A [Helicobacter bilis]MDD7297305.1 flagellin A [Helicobacter bilis]
MSFRINTNIAALNAHTIGVQNNRAIANSLEKLSSGLRINKAADDASGMSIADSLRSQASSLGQAIGNANDAIGMIQIADKAMDEQLKILDTVKVKAIQAAQDGQTTESRRALQNDIVRLLEELDNIANTTSYNGQQMLSGAFSNKEFQIGAYSNTTVKASIGPTSSDKIGHVRLESSSVTGIGMLASAGAKNLKEVALKFRQVDGKKDYKLETAVISTSAGTGIGVLADTINKFSDTLGVRAYATVLGTGGVPVQSGTVHGLVVNGTTIGTINDVRKNDADGRLINAFNSIKERTGVEAYVDIEGRLNLRSLDGRAISVHAEGKTGAVLGGGSFAGVSGTNHAIVGRISLVRTDARDIIVSGTNFSSVGFHSAQGIAQYTVNLRSVRGNMDANIASASGANANAAQAVQNKDGIGAGVTSLRGAMVVMDMAESATRQLDKIRADMGSVQMQLVATINNISITQVNVKAAESQIRDVDFAQESATFSKHNILAQSGSFAMAQANAVQQNVLRLLQ